MHFFSVGASASAYMVDNRRTNCAPYMNRCKKKHKISYDRANLDRVESPFCVPMSTTLRDQQLLHFYMLLKSFCNLLRISDEWT